MAISADVGAVLENYVVKLVDSGRYNSKSEVIREGIRLVQEREQKLAALDASIARGIAEAEAGLLMNFEDVHAQLRVKYSPSK